MEWIKTKVKYILYSDFNDKQFKAYMSLMALTAQIEQLPTQEQRLKVCHHATLKSLNEVLMKARCSLDEVLMKVLCDVDEVVEKRNQAKRRMQEFREKNKDVTHNVTQTERKREDKIREDKIILREENASSPVRFSPPLLEDVKKYISENNLSNVDANIFLDHYTANGWHIGKAKMKNWQSTIKNWHRRGKSKEIKDVRNFEVI